jgi:hypothetical protein
MMSSIVDVFSSQSMTQSVAPPPPFVVVGFQLSLLVIDIFS